MGGDSEALSSVMAKVTLITTIYNEAATIESFLTSVMEQTRLPDEIVIVDACSTDGTWEKVQEFFHKKTLIPVQLMQEKGNRSVGRNTAIKYARNDIIVATDAGCTLDKKWCEKISAPFENGDIDVVSGFYHPMGRSVFQKCLATYTSVMPDKLNPDTYLPSSRSVAFTKDIWKKAGKYPERLTYCEDLVFAKKLQSMGARMIFIRDALVYWPQKNNFSQAAKQFYNYAYGDGQARYIRKNTPFLFARYLVGLFLFFTFKPLLLILLILYVVWAIRKNYRYVRKPLAYLYLPLLQFTADFAVMSGMIAGILSVWATPKTR